MATDAYIGINDIARKLKGGYIGIGKLINLLPTPSQWSLSNVNVVHFEGYGETFQILTGGLSMAQCSLPAPIVGHKYYGRCSYMTDGGGFSCADGRFEYYYSDAPNGLMVFQSAVNNDTSGKVIVESSIQSISEDITGGATMWTFRNFVVNGTQAVYRAHPLLIDLTAAFGSGNEPTKEWCDANIPNFIGTLDFNYGKGIARKIVKVYIGDENGKARLSWENKRFAKLISGVNFRNATPSSVTSIIFTDEVVPSSYNLGATLSGTTYIDVSDAGDGSVIAWLVGTVCKVSSQNSSVIIQGNEDCSAMFGLKESLTNIELYNFDTSNVTNMTGMFRCSALTSLTLSNLFDTSKVTDMTSMFNNCGLSTLTLPSTFNTSNVTNMSYMFYQCLNLTSLTLSETFDTSNVTNMYQMFYYDTKLETIYVYNDFNIDKVTNGTQVFYGCRSLVGGNGTFYNARQSGVEYAVIDEGDNMGYFTRIT